MLTGHRQGVYLKMTMLPELFLKCRTTEKVTHLGREHRSGQILYEEDMEHHYKSTPAYHFVVTIESPVRRFKRGKIILLCLIPVQSFPISISLKQ